MRATPPVYVPTQIAPSREPFWHAEGDEVAMSEPVQAAHPGADPDAPFAIGVEGPDLTSRQAGICRNRGERAVVHPGKAAAPTAGGGLARVDKGRISTWTVADGLPANQLTALARDGQGSLWIGTTAVLSHRVRLSALTSNPEERDVQRNRGAMSIAQK